METNSKNWIVYCTTNTVNNKIYIGVHKTDSDKFDGYIGCGVHVNSPCTYNNPEQPFQFAVKKYGCKNFIRKTLKANLTKEEAYALEKILVDKDFVKRKDTYNASIGGNGGKLAIPVYQFSLTGSLIKYWEDGVEEISNTLGISKSGLYNAITYKGSNKNSYWSYDKTIDVLQYCNNAGKRVFFYDADSLKLSGYYSSIAEASEELGIKKDLIQRSIKCGYKTHGFYFSEDKMPYYEQVKAKKVGSRPIHLYTLNGDYYKTLNTKEEIFNFFSIKTLSSIRDAIRSNKVYRGYQISLTKEERLPEAIDERNYAKKVGCYTIDGELVEIFDTVTKARDKYGRSVSECLKGQRKTTKGYQFKYVS